MKLFRYLAIVLILFSTVSSKAQTFIFGPKFGPTVGLQQWNGIQGDALIAGHFAVFIESYKEDDPSSLYAQLGLHQRGSAERNLVINRGLGDIVRRSNSYVFNNISLLLGAKRLLKMESKANPFYTLGVRLEYTVNSNLDDFSQQPFFPQPFFINKINYGISGGGGFQYQFGDLVGGTVELTISPDISKQYEQPPFDNIVDPRDVGGTRTLPQLEARNISMELSVSIRLLRKVEYY